MEQAFLDTLPCVLDFSVYCNKVYNTIVFLIFHLIHQWRNCDFLIINLHSQSTRNVTLLNKHSQRYPILAMSPSNFQLPCLHSESCKLLSYRIKKSTLSLYLPWSNLLTLTKSTLRTCHFYNPFPISSVFYKIIQTMQFLLFIIFNGFYLSRLKRKSFITPMVCV